MNEPLADAILPKESNFAALLSSSRNNINALADLLSPKERDEIKTSLANELQENADNPRKCLQVLSDHLTRTRDLLLERARR
jgi:hypothetical protein